MVVHHSPGKPDVVFVQIDILNPLLMPQILVWILVGSLESISPSSIVNLVWLQYVFQDPGVVPHNFWWLRGHIDCVEASAAHVVGSLQVVGWRLNVLHWWKRHCHLFKRGVEVVIDYTTVDLLLISLSLPIEHLRLAFIIIPWACILLFKSE